jgi:hypothetical protein
MTLRRGPGILVLVLAGAVAACASPAGNPPAESPTAVVEPPATGDPATAPPTPTRTPSVVAPSPTPAGLIVRLDVCADVCIDPRRDEYLDDGRVVHLDLTAGRLMERRLSPAGLARVEARVAADADLLGADLTVDPVPLPGKEPPGHGAISYTFYAPADAGGRATVRTVTPGSLDAGYWTPDPRIDRLTALGDALLDPEALAGPDGWAEAAWAPYGAAKTAVFVHAREGIAPFSSPDLGANGWPGGGDPRAFGEPFASPLDAWPLARCAVVDAAEAAGAVAALPGPLDPSDPDAFWREGTFGWEAGGLEVLVVVRTLLPDEETLPCEDLWVPWG